MPVTTEFQPAGNGMTFRPVNMALGASWSRVLTDAFSFGVTLKYVRKILLTCTTRTCCSIWASGMISVLPDPFCRGTHQLRVQYNARWFHTCAVHHRYHRHRAGRRCWVPLIFSSWICLDALALETHQLTAAAQLNHPTDNNETYSIGLEYGWKKLLFVRSGYQFATDLAARPSFGFGVRVPRYFGTVQLDYGFQYMNRLGTVNRIGLQLSL